MTQKPAGNPGAQARQDLANKQSTWLLLVYQAMGRSRSLERLQRLLAVDGQQFSLTTLKTYSARYDWQARVREMDERDAVTEQARHIQVIGDMNEVQAHLGKTFQNISADSLQLISLNPSALSPRDTVAFAEVGSKLERLARGEATTRTDARVHAYTVVVDQIVEVFAGIVRDHELPQGAIDAFISGTDAVVNRALAEGGRDD